MTWSPELKGRWQVGPNPISSPNSGERLLAFSKQLRERVRKRKANLKALVARLAGPTPSSEHPFDVQARKFHNADRLLKLRLREKELKQPHAGEVKGFPKRLGPSARQLPGPKVEQPANLSE
jgi:hypothetical protein